MSYQVLARKWRPQTFTDVVGQEHVLTAIVNSLSLGNIHHAYLLSGTRGVGKTTIARLLAKGLNCETGITATFCNQCDNCLEVEQCRFIDLIEIDAASRTKVEDTRELLDNVQYAPVRGRFKVYLIDEVHMLSRHSFNALLKTLEEPPRHVKFLLVTTDPQKLPVTILSRCLQFHLKALNIKQIRNQLSCILQQEQIFAESRALKMIAYAAEGSMRDALSLTDQAIAMGQGKVSTEAVSLMLGTLNTEQPLALIEALANADGDAMMTQLAQYASRGMDWDNLLIEMLSLLHSLALGQLVPDQFTDIDDPAIIPRLRKLARSLPPTDLQLYYQILLAGRKEMPFAPDPRMGVEMTLLRALAFHPTSVEMVTIVDSTGEEASKLNTNTRNKSIITSTTATTNVQDISAFNPAPARLILDNARYNENIAQPLNGVPKSALFSKDVSTGLQLTEAKRQNRIINSAPVALALASTHISSLSDINQFSQDNGEKRNVMQVQAAISFEEANEFQSNWQNGALRPEKEVIQTYCAPSSKDAIPLPEVTAQILQARTVLLEWQKNRKIKKDKMALSHQKIAITPLKLLAAVGKCVQQHQSVACQKEPATTQSVTQSVESYRWRDNQQPEATRKQVITPKLPCTALKYKKTPELVLRLAEESLIQDSWTAQLNRLILPKLVQQLALNAWKEDLAPDRVCLHLRTSQRHLNSASAQSILCTALSADLGTPIKLTITEDDNPAMKTPLEWYQTIYEEKLMRAREVIINDAHIQTLQYFFDAELDEDSIRPI